MIVLDWGRGGSDVLVGSIIVIVPLVPGLRGRRARREFRGQRLAQQRVGQVSQHLRAEHLLPHVLQHLLSIRGFQQLAGILPHHVGLQHEPFAQALRVHLQVMLTRVAVGDEVEPQVPEDLLPALRLQLLELVRVLERLGIRAFELVLELVQ